MANDFNPMITTANFSVYRDLISTNININTFSTDTNPNIIIKEDVISTMNSDNNIALLSDLIIQKNGIGLISNNQTIIDKVSQFIQSWINLGKFDKLNSFLSFSDLINYYNKEFVYEFSDTILPADILKFKSIPNPNGLYAQQTRTLSFSSKKPPFWERALYKRLEDRKRDIPLDETEQPFYKFELTGKKIPDATKIGDIYERENMNINMRPKY